MISEEKIIEELFQKNQLNKVKHKEFLDACKDRSIDLNEKGCKHEEIVKTINEDIIVYKKENKIYTIDRNSPWSNHYWYLIVSAIINTFYGFLYKNLFKDKDILTWIILINIGIVIFNALLFGIKNLKELKKHIEFGLYSLLFYTPLLLYKVTTPNDINPILGIISNFGIIPFLWIIIKSLFSKNISVNEILILVVYSFLITSFFVVEYFVIWLIVLIMIVMISLAVLINSTKDIYKLTKNEIKITAVKTLLLAMAGASIYIFLKSFINPTYFLQIFTICYTLANLAIYVIFTSRSSQKSINIFWILFLLYEITRFIVSVSRYSDKNQFGNYYQSVFILIIPMIMSLVGLINKKIAIERKNEK